MKRYLNGMDTRLLVHRSVPHSLSLDAIYHSDVRVFLSSLRKVMLLLCWISMNHRDLRKRHIYFIVRIIVDEHIIYQCLTSIFKTKSKYSIIRADYTVGR